MHSEEDSKDMHIRREALAQRAFAIVHVKSEGYLLMKTFKKRKSEHLQLPGGRIDPEDFDAVNVSRKVQDLSEHEMLQVAETSLFREFKEETGIDFHKFKDHLFYLKNVSNQVAERSHRKKKLRKYGHVKGTHHPRKFFFLLDLDQGDVDLSTITLSNEHTGCVIEPNIHKAIEATGPHSGGDSAEALRIYFEERNGVIKVTE